MDLCFVLLVYSPHSTPYSTSTDLICSLCEGGPTIIILLHTLLRVAPSLTLESFARFIHMRLEKGGGGFGCMRLGESTQRLSIGKMKQGSNADSDRFGVSELGTSDMAKEN